ncbi:YrdB family protein [Microbacterium sp. G2-8]|uniref:YrdB family protein n=1 Tax=Microbacterium sp. G2-8 TaxID=2842454 RepID=UPI001C8949C2|nr:YrdB family protein [Microbacterium sp. G2-8]
MPDTSVAGVSRPRITPLDVLRLLSEIVAVASLALWGFLAWPLPWSIAFGLGAPILAILVWAVFVSPRAMLRVHPFVRALVELLIFVSATLALWALELPWAGLVVGLFCVVVGVLVGRRDRR